MLQTIRDRFTGKFAIGMLALIGVPFAFFGINYNFIDSGYAAKVNDMEISRGELDQAFREEMQQYAQYELPAEYRQIIKKNTLEGLIQRRLFDEYMIKSGYRVGSDVVTSAIQRVPEFLDENGKFSRPKYDEWLQINGFTHKQFESSQQRSMERSQLQGAIGATAFVTPTEYRQYLSLVLEQRQVVAVKFEMAKLAEASTASPEEIEAWYNDRPDEFLSPESVDLQYVEVRQDATAQSVNLSDEEIADYYKSASARYLQDEQRRASHILIVNEDDAAAKAQAEDLLARINAGESFETLAKEYSADGGSAPQGGDLGFSTRSQQVGSLGGAIFSMTEGEVRGPIKSDFGYHIVRLDEIKAGGPLPLEQVRPELVRELSEQRVADLYRAQIKKLSDSLFDAKDIAQLSAASGLPIEEAKGYTRNGGEPFGTNQAAIDAVFDPIQLNSDQLSEVIELDASRSVVFHISKHNPASRQALADVSDMIAAAIKQDKAGMAIKAKADALAVAVRGGADFATAAKEAGATEVVNGFVPRTAESPSEVVLNSIFATAKPAQGSATIGRVADQNGDYVVFSLTAVAPGRPEAVAQEELDAAKKRLAAQNGSADFNSFIADLRSKAKVDISDDAFAEQDFFQ